MQIIQTKKTHNKEVVKTVNLAEILTHFVEDKLPDQFQLSITAQIPVVDAVAIQFHLESHLVVREGKRILVPHRLKDQGPPGAEDAKILVMSQIISRS